MKNDIIQANPPFAKCRLASLIPADAVNTPGQKATLELLQHFDDFILKMPLELQDFVARSFRSFGLPIDYPGLPFWTERAARHVYTILLPTMRKADWTKPTPENFGKVCGHALAVISYAKEGTAIFQRLPTESAQAIREFFVKMEAPLQVLILEGQSLPPAEAKAFICGFAFAFARTFDAVGLPRGWNTNSPVLMGLCIGWRYIVMQEPTLLALRNHLARIFGEQEIGTEDRVKKICHRIGLQFSGDRAAGRQGTSEILDVPTIAD